jgi:hypothetical protein
MSISVRKIALTIRGITHEQKKKEKNPQNLADSFKGIDACQLCKHFPVCACME